MTKKTNSKTVRKDKSSQNIPNAIQPQPKPPPKPPTPTPTPTPTKTTQNSPANTQISTPSIKIHQIWKKMMVMLKTQKMIQELPS